MMLFQLTMEIPLTILNYRLDTTVDIWDLTTRVIRLTALILAIGFHEGVSTKYLPTGTFGGPPACLYEKNVIPMYGCKCGIQLGGALLLFVTQAMFHGVNV